MRRFFNKLAEDTTKVNAYVAQTTHPHYTDKDGNCSHCYKFCTGYCSICGEPEPPVRIKK